MVKMRMEPWKTSVTMAAGTERGVGWRGDGRGLEWGGRGVMWGTGGAEGLQRVAEG